MPKPVPVNSVVYAIRAADMVKIGTTTNLRQRLKAIQMHSPVKLEVIGTIPGDRHREAAFHREFAEYRQHGEWFKLPPEAVEALSRQLGEPSWQESVPGKSKRAVVVATDRVLRAVRTAREQRDQAVAAFEAGIIKSHAEKTPVTTIAAECGWSRQAVYDLLKRHSQ